MLSNRPRPASGRASGNERLAYMGSSSVAPGARPSGSRRGGTGRLGRDGQGTSMTVCRCGGQVPREQGPTHAYMRATPACWRLYGELTVGCTPNSGWDSGWRAAETGRRNRDHRRGAPAHGVGRAGGRARCRRLCAPAGPPNRCPAAAGCRRRVCAAVPARGDAAGGDGGRPAGRRDSGDRQRGGRRRRRDRPAGVRQGRTGPGPGVGSAACRPGHARTVGPSGATPVPGVVHPATDGRPDPHGV